MKSSKKMLVLRLVAFMLVFAFLLPIDVSAAVPETVQPTASAYLSAYTAYICPMGGGDLQIWFEVIGTRSWTDIGALSIELFESTDGSNWSWVRTFHYSDYSTMLDHNSGYHASYVYYQGNRDSYYKACVCIWAGSEETGDSRYIWTGVEQAY